MERELVAALESGSLGLFFPQKQMQSKDSPASRVFRRGFWKLKFVHEDVNKAKEGGLSSGSYWATGSQYP